MGDQLPVLNLRGRAVALGPLRRDLVPLYHRWLNDWEVTATMEEQAPERLDDTERWYDRNDCADVRDQVTFTLYELASGRPMGVTSLQQIDHLHRTAMFSLIVGGSSSSACTACG